MTTFRDYLEKDGELVLLIGFANVLPELGTMDTYSSICGSWVDGVYQWASHNIYNVSEVSNSKYTGWIITTSDGSEYKVYIPNWVLNLQPKNWKHAKNLFKKYLRLN